MRMTAVLAAAVGMSAISSLRAVDAPPQYYVEQAPQEQIVYQDCVTHSCKLVPETKQIKKTVYEVKDEPFCLKKLPPLWALLHHHGCDCEICADCQCPRYRKVLIKKEIVCKEICTSKCVVQEHVERVPCKVCAPACK